MAFRPLFIPVLLKYFVLACLLLSPFSLADENPQACPDKTLDILLTNDDGFDKPGIRALLQVFKQAGHHVVLAAPAKNASGGSASVTFAAIAVTETEPDVFAINGSPATTVLLSISALFPNKPPDLVISGINNGANLGPATPLSGTVGATIAAILIAEPAIPAIAISTEPFVIEGKSDAENKQTDLKHLNRVAEFILALVGKLQAQHCDDSALLAPRVALNVNYPAIAQEHIKGVQLQSQGKAPLFSLFYAPSENDPNIYVPHFEFLPPTYESNDGDTGAFHDGYITIVPIDADYTASQKVTVEIMAELQGLKP